MSLLEQFLFRRRVLPLMYQAEAAECGLVSLAMVCGYYGHHVSMVSLRQRFRVSLRGMSLASLMEIAVELGLKPRALKVSLAGLSEVSLPAILHWQMTHFVVLKSVRRKGIEIHDPGKGLAFVDWGEASKSFTGVVLELTPEIGFSEHKSDKGVRLGDFYRGITGLKASVAEVLSLTLTCQALLFCVPLATQQIVDFAAARGPGTDMLLPLGAGATLLTLLSAIVGYGRARSVVLFGAHVNSQMSVSLFNKLLSLPVAFFSARHVGDLISRYGSKEVLRRFVSEGAVPLALSALTVAGALALLCFYSPTLAGAAVLLGVLLAVFRLSLLNNLKILEEKAVQSAAIETSHVIETFRRISAIKTLSAEARRYTEWWSKAGDALRAGARLETRRAQIEAGSSAVDGVGRIVILCGAAAMTIDGAMSIGAMFAFLAYREMFGQALNELLGHISSLKSIGVHVRRLEDFVVAAPEVPHGVQQEELEVHGRLSARGLSFSYSDEVGPLISEASFEVNQGQFLAIVGRTGAGKSTLMKLLVGLESATAGRIEVDGVTLDSSLLRSFRRQVGYVTQEESLFSGTIADNIVGSGTRDRRELEKVARLAGILEEVLAMPMKFETLVGDMGAALSGGQRQRIAIARALYNQPKILFLDEATSQLDVKTEALVLSNIRQLGITCIMIAHRPDAVEWADVIMLCQDGRVSQCREGAQLEALIGAT